MRGHKSSEAAVAKESFSGLSAGHFSHREAMQLSALQFVGIDSHEYLQNKEYSLFTGIIFKGIHSNDGVFLVKTLLL